MALAFALLLGLGGTALWLDQTGQLAPLLAARPQVDLPLPPPEAASPAPEPAAAEAPASETTEPSAATTGTTTAPAAEPSAAPTTETTAGSAESDTAASAPDNATAEPAAGGTPAPSDTSETATASDAGETPAASDMADTAVAEPDSASVTPPPPPAAAPGSEAAADTPTAAPEVTMAAPAAPSAEAEAGSGSITATSAPAATDQAPTETTVPPAASDGATVATEPSAPTATPPTPLAADEASPAPTAPAVASAAPAAPEAPSAGETELAAVAPPAAPIDPPWRRYARPFPLADPRPRIAIVITELGLSRAATEAAIERLPPEITLAFNPLAPNLQSWIVKARARGHEVMLDLPMEPLAYPNEDPGPHALLASLGPVENLRRLGFLLSRADGYVGVASYMGSRFEGAAELIDPVLRRLAEKGYMFLANRSGPTSAVPAVAGALQLPYASNDRFLDTEATRVAIEGRLQQLERLARTRKGAIAMGLPYPVTIERVAAWAETLGAKGIALAPVSALVGVVQP